MVENTTTMAVPSGTTSTVAETVGKEYEFYHRNLTKAMKDGKIPVLRRLCADDPRNNNAENAARETNCKFCGRKGYGTSKNLSLEQLIDTAAFIGTVVSTGTLVSSHLSTNCSRLQKQARSLAALSCNSYVDVIHTKFLGAAEDLLVKYQHRDSKEVESEDEFAEATRVKFVAGDNVVILEDVEEEIGETNHPGSKPTSMENEEASMMPELVMLYNGRKFESQLTRFQLTGAALHAQAFKYDKETKFTSCRDSISFTNNNRTCTCAETLTQLLSPTQEKEENEMVQENFQAGSV